MFGIRLDHHIHVLSQRLSKITTSSWHLQTLLYSCYGRDSTPPLKHVWRVSQIAPSQPYIILHNPIYSTNICNFIQTLPLNRQPGKSFLLRLAFRRTSCGVRSLSQQLAGQGDCTGFNTLLLAHAKSSEQLKVQESSGWFWYEKHGSLLTPIMLLEWNTADLPLQSINLFVSHMLNIDHYIGITMRWFFECSSSFGKENATQYWLCMFRTLQALPSSSFTVFKRYQYMLPNIIQLYCMNICNTRLHRGLSVVVLHSTPLLLAPSFCSDFWIITASTFGSSPYCMDEFWQWLFILHSNDAKNKFFTTPENTHLQINTKTVLTCLNIKLSDFKCVRIHPLSSLLVSYGLNWLPFELFSMLHPIAFQATKLRSQNAHFFAVVQSRQRFLVVTTCDYHTDVATVRSSQALIGCPCVGHGSDIVLAGC